MSHSKASRLLGSARYAEIHNNITKVMELLTMRSMSLGPSDGQVLTLSQREVNSAVYMLVTVSSVEIQRSTLAIHLKFKVIQQTNTKTQSPLHSKLQRNQQSQIRTKRTSQKERRMNEK